MISESKREVLPATEEQRQACITEMIKDLEYAREHKETKIIFAFRKELDDEKGENKILFFADPAWGLEITKRLMLDAIIPAHVVS